MRSQALSFHNLNSYIERGTKPDAVGSKPCHWTSTLKAAMVNAKRARKYSNAGCYHEIRVRLESVMEEYRKT